MLWWNSPSFHTHCRAPNAFPINILSPLIACNFSRCGSSGAATWAFRLHRTTSSICRLSDLSNRPCGVLISPWCDTAPSPFYDDLSALLSTIAMATFGDHCPTECESVRGPVAGCREDVRGVTIPVTVCDVCSYSCSCLDVCVPREMAVWLRRV